jgi:uncharacterized paraquat-inducible protein A
MTSAPSLEPHAGDGEHLRCPTCDRVVACHYGAAEFGPGVAYWCPRCGTDLTPAWPWWHRQTVIRVAHRWRMWTLRRRYGDNPPF